jgi:DNA modification methylase
MRRDTTFPRATRARTDSVTADPIPISGRAPLDVEWWPIERPIPYARNPRIAPEAAIAKVAASLREYGWRQPIVVDREGVIVVGRTRLLAAQRLGLTQVPVHVASDLSPTQIKAYRLADNRSAQESSWDYELLPLEIGELAALDYELDVLGFDPDEVAAIMATPTSGLSDPDEVLAPPAEPRTRAGDLWLLGEHRLLCGDATDAEQVKRLMAGRRACLMATDPPYLVDYSGGNHPPTQGNGGKAGRAYEKGWDAYIDAEHSVAFYRDFLTVALKSALIEAPVIYQCFGMTRVEVVLAAWHESGLLAHQVLIWKKSRAVLTYSDYLWDYEPILYGWVEGRRPKMRPPADSRAVWEIASAIEDKAGGIHPTQKPIELVRRPILYHSKPGSLLYEPFSGSGTALIAAEELGRICYAMELSPAFVDATIERWQRFSGREAVLNG